MPVLSATWVDVFAERPLQGNFHLVVHDADDLADDVMRRFSARTRLAETSFVQPATVPEATYRHRIFVPGKEVPFAGHPSLGTAAAVAWRSGRSSGTVVQETLSGLQTIELELSTRGGRASILQNPADFGDELERDDALGMMGLDRRSAHPALRPQWVSTGMPTLVIPMRSARELASLRFDWGASARMVDTWGAASAYNFYACGEIEPGHWAARCFGEDPLTGEDPATGSAAGPLGAYLHRHLGVERVVVDQGVEMGSPSRLYVDTADGIRVAGAVRLVGTGTLELPSG